MPSVSVPLIAAAATTAGSIGSSLISSNASQSAASTQAAAANRAADLQLQQQQQVRADLGPYNVTGQGAISKLASLYGLPTSSTQGGGTTTTSVDPFSTQGLTDLFSGKPLTQTTTTNPLTTTTQPTSYGNELAMLEATPGYQFTLAQGLKSTQNSAAARGLGTSGAALKGAAEYATGLAQNTYQQNLLSPLQYLGTLGESAAAQTGTLGTQGTASAGSAIVGAGNASASGTVGSANALSSGLSSAASTPLNYLLYSNLLGSGSSSGSGSSGNGVSQLGSNY